ncbi:MAG: ATP-binding protein [bacterium]
MDKSKEEQRGLLASLHHELRSTVTVIIGCCELLLENKGKELGNEQATSLQRLRLGSIEWLRLIDDLLGADANRNQSGEEALRHRCRSSLHAILGNAEMLLDQVREKSLKSLIPDMQTMVAAGRRLLLLVEKCLEEGDLQIIHSQTDPTKTFSAPDVDDVLSVTSPISPAASQEQPGFILVVDNQEQNRDLLVRRLEGDGHGVEIASSGQQALDLARSQKPELILLNLILPEMTGHEVLQQLKADEGLMNIPVIVISALAESNAAARCVEIGADDYLTLPIAPVLLRARVNSCLEKKRLRDREKQLFTKLQESYDRLEALGKLKDDLTHMIIHDLRTPLTSVITGLMTIEGVGELEEVQKELLDNSIYDGQVLLGMVNDLLDITKMEDGSLQLERAELEPHEIISRALEQVQTLAKEKHQVLDAKVENDLKIINADEDKLRRTLVNLVGNSVKFTPENGTITISVKLDKHGDPVIFAVSDTGEGIPKEAFEKIFEKFGQVESRKSGRKMSTGLGLTFCKMAVEAHGGRIWVESELGKGTTFWFTIPSKT